MFWAHETKVRLRIADSVKVITVMVPPSVLHRSWEHWSSALDCGFSSITRVSSLFYVSEIFRWIYSDSCFLWARWLESQLNPSFTGKSCTFNTPVQLSFPDSRGLQIASPTLTGLFCMLLWSQTAVCEGIMKQPCLRRKKGPSHHKSVCKGS